MAEPQLSVRARRPATWHAAWRAANIDPLPMSWNARSKLMKFARRGASRQPLSRRALLTTMAAISIWRLSFAKTGRSIQDRSFDLPRHQRYLGDAAQDAKPRCDRLAGAE
jgi:hypothetical protein